MTCERHFLIGSNWSGQDDGSEGITAAAPPPLSYIEGDTFWSFISKDGERGARDIFPVLIRSMTAAAVPFARSAFRALIDFSIPPTYVDTGTQASEGSAVRFCPRAAEFRSVRRTRGLSKGGRDLRSRDVAEFLPERWGAGCSFVDYDRDGHLDLFVSNYVRFSFKNAQAPGENSHCAWKGVPVECRPRGLATGRHSLYHNNGDGTFTDVSEPAGITRATPSYGMTVIAADFDEDG